ncbi:MAG: cytochrome C oxidase subunit III [Deltaproteobacteria bacterium RBG_16_49_23]|nr:MAG: cytochrome C oxidase subunit III [Deltaproteobacteria bacterium RBG_16_49_23]
MKNPQNDTGSKMGMWLFLLSEILLFGGLFILYSVYRFNNPQAFHLAAEALDRPLGTLNTLILLTSSLTMALSISFLKKGGPRRSLLFLSATLFLGLLFLFNKYLEWTWKVHHGIYPDAPRLLEREKGEVLFYGLYYSMTGLHGLHVLAGVLLLSVMFIFILRGNIHRNHFVPLENTGLYWHLVDIIWVFLFPLFYLIT